MHFVVGFHHVKQRYDCHGRELVDMLYKIPLWWRVERSHHSRGALRPTAPSLKRKSMKAIAMIYADLLPDFVERGADLTSPKSTCELRATAIAR